MRVISKALVCAFVLAMLALPASAASEPEGLAYVLDDNGDPYVYLQSGFNEKATYAWQRCLPGAPTCDSISASPKYGAAVEPGEMPAGTRFILSITNAGSTKSITSRVWNGRVGAVTPPGFSPAPAPGQLLWPQSGIWSGGWGDEYDVLGVEACRTAFATGCETLWDPAEDYIFSPTRPRLGSFYAGRYLFATARRYSYDTAFAGVGHFYPEDIPALKASATNVRSAPIGPATVDKTRTARILAGATIRNGGIAIARVRCAKRCELHYSSIFTRKGRMVALSEDTIRLSGSRVLRVPAPGAKHATAVRSHIWIDHGLAARATEKVRH